MHIKQTTSF
jgi:hypothetical protein